MPDAALDPATEASIDEAVARLAGSERLELRSGQREGIRAALTRDTLVVQATGFGKTLIYEVTGAVLGGTTLVVSPTVSLQMDQVAALRGRGQRAEAVNSLLGAAARRRALESVAAGGLDVLLVSPEQLTRSDVRKALDESGVGLVAVDEAHCVSAWGHEFRPDYLGLPAVISALGSPRVLALTATASPGVRRDIVASLRLRDPAVVVGDADRPNIWLGAQLAVDDDDAGERALQLALDELGDGAAIVYVSTRRRAEQLAERARELGDGRARHYHGSLARRDREQVLAGFHSGDIPLVVATSAFGLGIDKADVRAVVHADPPEDLDTLYQQVGRAGRDGEPAKAVLFSRPSGYRVARYFAGRGDADPGDLRAVLRELGDRPTTLKRLRESTALSAARVRRSANALIGVGAVSEARAGLRLVQPPPVDDPVEVAMHASEQRRVRTETGIELVRRYGETDDCRRRLVLQLLGEQVVEPCGHCDNCDAGTSRPADPEGLLIGRRVRHPEFGFGTVQQFEEDRVTVLFEDAGYRTLSREVADEHHLIESA